MNVDDNSAMEVKPLDINENFETNLDNFDQDDDRISLLYAAILMHDMDGVQENLKSNLDFINIQLDEGFTFLHLAVFHGDLAIVKYLIRHGANINLTTDKGQTALHLALENKFESIAKYFIQETHGCDLDIADINGETSLHYAIKNDIFPLAELLIQCGCNINYTTSFGETPLHYAASAGQTNIAELLLKNKCDKNPANQDGVTPLHYAMEWNHLDVVKKLISYGCNKNSVDNDGETPLHYAIFTGKPKILKEAIDKGWGDISITTHKNETIMHFAAKNGKTDILKYLYTNKKTQRLADIQTTNGLLPIHYAIKYGKLDAADVCVKNNNKTSNLVKLIEEKIDFLLTENINSQEYRLVETVSCLLKICFKVDIIESSYFPYLQWCCRAKEKNASSLIFKKIFTVLLDFHEKISFEKIDDCFSSSYPKKELKENLVSWFISQNTKFNCQRYIPEGLDKDSSRVDLVFECNSIETAHKINEFCLTNYTVYSYTQQFEDKIVLIIPEINKSSFYKAIHEKIEEWAKERIQVFFNQNQDFIPSKDFFEELFPNKLIQDFLISKDVSTYFHEKFLLNYEKIESLVANNSSFSRSCVNEKVSIKVKGEGKYLINSNKIFDREALFLFLTGFLPKSDLLTIDKKNLSVHYNFFIPLLVSSVKKNKFRLLIKDVQPVINNIYEKENKISSLVDIIENQLISLQVFYKKNPTSIWRGIIKDIITEIKQKTKNLNEIFSDEIEKYEPETIVNYKQKVKKIGEDAVDASFKKDELLKTQHLVSEQIVALQITVEKIKSSLNIFGKNDATVSLEEYTSTMINYTDHIGYLTRLSKEIQTLETNLKNDKLRFENLRTEFKKIPQTLDFIFIEFLSHKKQDINIEDVDSKEDELPQMEEPIIQNNKTHENPPDLEETLNDESKEVTDLPIIEDPIIEIKEAIVWVMPTQSLALLETPKSIVLDKELKIKLQQNKNFKEFNSQVKLLNDYFKGLKEAIDAFDKNKRVFDYSTELAIYYYLYKMTHTLSEIHFFIREKNHSLLNTYPNINQYFMLFDNDPNLLESYNLRLALRHPVNCGNIDFFKFIYSNPAKKRVVNTIKSAIPAIEFYIHSLQKEGYCNWDKTNDIKKINFTTEDFFPSFKSENIESLSFAKTTAGKAIKRLQRIVAKNDMEKNFSSTEAIASMKGLILLLAEGLNVLKFQHTSIFEKFLNKLKVLRHKNLVDQLFHFANSIAHDNNRNTTYDSWLNKLEIPELTEDISKENIIFILNSVNVFASAFNSAFYWQQPVYEKDFLLPSPEHFYAPNSNAYSHNTPGYSYSSENTNNINTYLYQSYPPEYLGYPLQDQNSYNNHSIPYPVNPTNATSNTANSWIKKEQTPRYSSPTKYAKSFCLLVALVADFQIREFSQFKGIDLAVDLEILESRIVETGLQDVAQLMNG
jgi:ankyrin repeat protein